MNSSAYLTIDDSASDRMDDLVSYLEGKGIPALFYCRGDMLEKNPDAAIRALKKGFTLANHTYSHQRAMEKDLDWYVADIAACEKILDDLHARANVKPSGKYFRFPHVDRGTGAWIIDYDANPTIRKQVQDEIAGGVNAPSKERPPESAFIKKQQLQNYLKQNGYKNPFTDATHRWFLDGEMGEAVDSLFTFSNCDWMLNERQIGKWPYKTPADLKHKARNDMWLWQEGSVNVILAHDQADIVDVTIELIDDMAETGLIFKDLS